MGSEKAAKEFGNLASARRTRVPDATSPSVSARYSASDPSTQWIRSGPVRVATSPTQSRSRSEATGAVSRRLEYVVLCTVLFLPPH
ncbi:hypothetical protein D9M68_1006060 [compost metagenome]